SCRQAAHVARIAARCMFGNNGAVLEVRGRYWHRSCLASGDRITEGGVGYHADSVKDAGPVTVRTTVSARKRRNERRRRVMAIGKIGIIGNGNVGSALGRGLERGGQKVQRVGHDMKAVRDCAEQADIVMLAVPFEALDEVVEQAGRALAGKTVVDVTNAVDANMNWAIGFTTSGAEELQKKLPQARVVKAFNTVFAQHMDTGRLGEQRLTAFVASDDSGAKSTVVELARAIGFDA